jgi:DNA-binding NtrC family response regulator
MGVGNLPNPVVLVVDDEALIRWSLCEGLTDAGYDVRNASSGADALVELTACDAAPLVVLLDLRLPDVSDLSLLRRIRVARPDAPVLLLTAAGTPDDMVEARRLGVASFLQKPFDIGEIVRLVGVTWKNRLPA